MASCCSRQNSIHHLTPKVVQILVPRACECVWLHCNGGVKVADEIKVDDLDKIKVTLRWEILLDYPGGPIIITRVLIQGRKSRKEPKR